MSAPLKKMGWLCSDTAEIRFDEVRVPFLKRDRPEVEELSGQRWVPVLVHGDDVINDSHRILEYLEWLEGKNK